MQHIYSKVRRCLEDYAMIAPDERIAVGVSGGKDSLLLLAALAGLRRFYPVPYHLEAISLDMGFPGVSLQPVAEFCAELEVSYTVVPTDIAAVVFDIRKEPNPCSLCAKLRRGALHEAALQKGCRKVALGHHADDAAETFWLSMVYEGRLSCFSPVTWLDRRDITLIRPMLYLWEEEVTAMKPNLPVVHNPCPANGYTKRQDVKERLAAMEAELPGFKQKLIRSIQRLPLKGWGTTNPPI